MKLSRIEAHLKCFKLGREALAAKFSKEDPALYMEMFFNEASPSRMELAKSKFFFEWVTSHPIIFAEENYSSSDHSPEDGQLASDFFEIYKMFLQVCFSGSGRLSSDTSDALLDLSQDYLRSIQAMLEISLSDREKLDRLRYQHEKSKKIFERELKKLQGDENGLV